MTQELVMEALEKLKIADKHAVAELMASQGIWKAGTSAVNNTYKKLMDLVALGRLVKGDGFFRVPSCKSEYGTHSQTVTSTLVKVLKVYPGTIVYREHTIHEVGLRPDALCLLIKEGKGLCLWIEVCNHEPPEYFEMKKNALKSWNALPYISRLFNYQIPAYQLVKDTELTPFLEEVA